MTEDSRVSVMHIELDADGYNRCMTETLTAEHKQIFLQFIRAERNFLDQPQSYPIHCDILAHCLNELEYLHDNSEWIEIMKAWENFVVSSYEAMMGPTDSLINTVLSAEDEDLMQHIHESKLWADPSFEQINCVLHYLETNANASDLWTTISNELDANGNNRRTETFWKQAFRRVVKRLKAKKELVNEIARKGFNVQLNPLTRIEMRLLNAMTGFRSDNILERAKRKSLLEHFSTHCRICLASTSTKMTFLFDQGSYDKNSMKNEVSLLEKLNYCSCLSVEAHENDGLPQYVCMSCSVLLESSYQLKLLCSKTEQKFQDLLFDAVTDIIDEGDLNELNQSVPTILENQKCDVHICAESYDLNEEYIIEFDEVNRIEENETKHVTIEETYEVESVQTRRETRRPKKKVIKADSNQNQTISFKFGCEKCKSQFASIASLEAHLKLGHDKVRQIRKKTHQCSLCPKRFRAKNTLNVHMRSHTGERPYQCEVCDKAFKTTSAVANHKAVHAQTKDFKCSQCSFTTSTKANLRVHDRTHSGVQPYKCDHCPMRFSTASNMVKHMRNIHEKLKTNKCGECGRSFFTRESLRKHSVIHSGLKPFYCPKCKMAYSWYNGLKKHIKMHHVDEGVQILTEKSYFDQSQQQLAQQKQQEPTDEIDKSN